MSRDQLVDITVDTGWSIQTLYLENLVDFCTEQEVDVSEGIFVFLHSV